MQRTSRIHASLTTTGVSESQSRYVELDRPVTGPARRSHLPCSESESARLEELHQEIGQALFTEIQPLIKQVVRADVANLRVVRYSDFVAQALYPACTVTARGTVSRHHMSWYCPPVTTAYLLDAMLGGGRYLPPPLHRSLTHIEQGLLTRLADAMWKQLETNWSAVTAMQLETAHLDSEGPRLRIAAANEMVMVVTWSLSNPFVRTMMQLLYPWSDVQAMMGQLHPQRHDRADRATPRRPHLVEPQAKEPATTSSVVIDWTHTHLTAQDIEDLSVGDLLVTDVSPATPAHVFVDGHFRYRATVGQQEGRRAIRLDAAE